MNDTWNIDFISKDDFYKHVKNTVDSYRSSLKSFDMEIFNSNTVDPIKLIFDKSIYQKNWEAIVSDEVLRQRDKGNNNSIGYFHQNIFQYINHCEVPQSGWDVIYRNDRGIDIGDGTKVSTVYVEMKNKHNTMNSSSASKTYSKAQKQLQKDNDCACFLVEVIAKQSQNISWGISIDGERTSNKLIRRVSIDQFYKMVTGEDLAFWKICQVLPRAIDDIVNNLKASPVPTDTVYDELIEIGNDSGRGFIGALYLLGFSSYLGFGDVHFEEIDFPE